MNLVPIVQFNSNAYSAERWAGIKENIGAHGMDFELGSKSMTVVFKSKDILVVKIPGHSHWTGNYQPRGYAPTRFMVLGIVEDNSHDDVIDVRAIRLAEFPARSLTR